jgi:hypothetical protein
MTSNTVWMSILLPKSAKQEKFTGIGLKDIEKHMNFPYPLTELNRDDW